MRRPVSFFGALASLLLLVGSALAQTTPQTIVIGTGPVAGTYFPAGGAICRVINTRSDLNGLRCLVAVTDGSAENLAGLADGSLDLALIQSDWQYHAVNGTAAGLTAPFSTLRSLLSLQGQAMAVVAGPKSGILELKDLPGKRVGLGPAGSGINEAARALITVLGFEGTLTPVESSVEEQVAALCAGELDAFLLPAAHPNGAVRDAVDLCGAVLVDVNGDAVSTLVKAWPFYVATSIPENLYAGNANAVPSFGIVATLVGTDRLPDAVAYSVVKAIIEGLDELKTQYPVLSDLTAERMVGDGASAATHPGAQGYFTEKQIK